MKTYVVLYKFTDQGAKDIRGSIERAAQAQSESERRGFKVHGVYWTQGRYDMVVVIDAPDEESMLAGLFNIAAAGNARSETLRAFTAAELQTVLQRMD